MVVGMHVDQGFCVRFPVQVDGEPLETWEEWSEREFLADAGSVPTAGPLSQETLAEANEVLGDADDGCHLHLHEE